MGVRRFTGLEVDLFVVLDCFANLRISVCMFMT